MSQNNMPIYKSALPEITGWAIGQGTYNNPIAAIHAHEQFDHQNAGGNRFLIIVDSSAAPNEATDYYEILAAKGDTPNVHYYHMPVRPGREANAAIDIARYPSAYRWQTDAELYAIYRQTIPSDAQLRQHYIEQADIAPALAAYGPKAFAEIMQCVGVELNPKQVQAIDNLSLMPGLWEKAVTEFTKAGKFHDRPHLGSKRNFIAAVAEKLGAQIVINYDDDCIGRHYVESQLRALQNSAFTAKMSYATLISPPDAAAQGKAPIWAVTELSKGGQGYLLDHEGHRIDGQKAAAQRSMGWTQARRIGKGMPQAPDILFGEDRALEDRYKNCDLETYLQDTFCRESFRLVFGASSSCNLVTRVMQADDHFMPSPAMQEEVLNCVRKMQGLSAGSTFPRAVNG